MSGSFVKEQLVAALTRLALPASAQAAYLEKLGTAPSTDELVLELDDFLPMLPVAVSDGVISATQALAIKSVGDYADSFGGSENAPLWEIGELYTAPQWEELRSLASTALKMLASKDSE
jgi:hypothetical protein